MTIPNMSDLEAYEPRWLGVRELNLGDAWRARWITGQPLPGGTPVDTAYTVLLSEGRGYLCRPRGADHWDVLEGTPAEGEAAEAFVKRVALERMGAQIKRLELLGFLECRATSHNPEVAAGTVRVRPFYTAAAGRLAPGPRDDGFERRRFPANEYLRAIRLRYPHFYEYLAAAIDRYLVLRAQGEVS